MALLLATSEVGHLGCWPFSSDLSADIKPSQTYFILQSNSRWSRLRILGSDASVDSSVTHMSAMSKSPKCQSWALVQDPSLWTTTPTCLYWTIKQSHITPDVHVHVQSGYGLVQLFVHLSFTLIVQIIYALTLAGACMHCKVLVWWSLGWKQLSALNISAAPVKNRPLVHKHGCRISIVLAWGLQSGPWPLGISSHGWFKSLLPVCPCRV